MTGWADAVVRLAWTDGTPLGTGFLVADGLLVTCARVLTEARTAPDREVIAHFEGGGPSVRFRVAPDGWFPRTRTRLCDEPDPLCDVAILEPVTPTVGLPPGLQLSPQGPVDDSAVKLPGYPGGAPGQPQCLDGTVRGTGGGAGDLTVTLGTNPGPVTLDQWRGAPVIHVGVGVVVGMLAGTAGGPNQGLLVLAEALGRALAAVRRAATPGPLLVLYEDKSWHANQDYASACLHSPSQDQRPGEGVRVWLSASFPKVSDGAPDGAPRVRQVRIAVEVPAGRLAEAPLGSTGDVPCGSPAVLLKRAVVGQQRPAWLLRAAEQNGDLHDHNAETEGPLFVLADAAAGDRLTMRMTALANRDYFQCGERRTGDRAARPPGINKQKIMKRLGLKAVEGSGPDCNGEILLSETEHDVGCKG